MVKQVKNIKFKGALVTICYAPTGQCLYQGDTNDIPAHLLNYYSGYQTYNKVKKTTYIEVTENKGWWDE